MELLIIQVRIRTLKKKDHLIEERTFASLIEVSVKIMFLEGGGRGGGGKWLKFCIFIDAHREQNIHFFLVHNW